MATVRPEFWVALKNKKYPVYEGVLIAAHEEGLLELKSRVIQYPNEANGWTAVCQATVIMKGDGEREQVFEDVGDCSPKNASPQIALASIRMASTRAKGRALRDAIALGATLFEELPAWETEKEVNAGVQPRPAANTPRAPAPHGPAPVATPGRAGMVPHPAASHAGGGERAAQASPQAEAGSCEVCHGAVSKNERTMSQHAYKRDLCRTHLAALRQQAEAAKQQPAA